MGNVSGSTCSAYCLNVGKQSSVFQMLGTDDIATMFAATTFDTSSACQTGSCACVRSGGLGSSGSSKNRTNSKSIFCDRDSGASPSSGACATGVNQFQEFEVPGIRAAEMEQVTAVRPVREAGNVSRHSATASHSAQSPGRDVMALQVVKNFVRSFVQGTAMHKLDDSGRVTEYFAWLDKKLTTLSLVPLTKESEPSSILLESISQICALDDFSVSLHLDRGSVVSFRFDDAEQRDTFALCLSMFVVDAPHVDTFLANELPAKHRRQNDLDPCALLFPACRPQEAV